MADERVGKEVAVRVRVTVVNHGPNNYRGTLNQLQVAAAAAESAQLATEEQDHLDAELGIHAKEVGRLATATTAIADIDALRAKEEQERLAADDNYSEVHHLDMLPAAKRAGESAGGPATAKRAKLAAPELKDAEVGLNMLKMRHYAATRLPHPCRVYGRARACATATSCMGAAALWRVLNSAPHHRHMSVLAVIAVGCTTTPRALS